LPRWYCTDFVSEARYRAPGTFDNRIVNDTNTEILQKSTHGELGPSRVIHNYVINHDAMRAANAGHADHQTLSAPVIKTR
jgi:hypothetical protein